MNDEDDQIAKAIDRLATHVKYLGVGDAATTMGAIEYLATRIEKGGEDIAGSLDGLAEAIRKVASALEEIADAVKDKLTDVADAIEDAATQKVRQP